jgi:hypothetical protein
VEVIGSAKHSSLLRYGNNYCRKKFYSSGPRPQVITIVVRTIGLSHQCQIQNYKDDCQHDSERTTQNTWNLDYLLCQIIHPIHQ